MHRQIRNKLQQNSNSPRSTRKTFLAKFFYSRPDLDSIDVANDDRRHRTHICTHARARAQTQDASLPRFSPFNGGEEGNPFRGCPVIRGYIVRGAHAPGGGEGWCVTPRAGWTNETRGGRKEGGREGGEQEESQFSNGPGESGGLYHIYWPTLPSFRPHPRHPPSAATNCPVTTPRTGRPAAGRSTGRCYHVIGATH